MTAQNPTQTAPQTGTPAPAAMKSRLAEAYDQSVAKIGQLETEIKQAKAENLAKVDEVGRQIKELEQEIEQLRQESANIEAQLPAQTAVIQTLIDAEQVKLNFLTAKAKELKAPTA